MRARERVVPFRFSGKSFFSPLRAHLSRRRPTGAREPAHRFVHAYTCVRVKFRSRGNDLIPVLIRIAVTGPTPPPGSSCSLNKYARVRTGGSSARLRAPCSALWKHCRRTDGRTDDRLKRYKPPRYWHNAYASVRNRISFRGRRDVKTSRRTFSRADYPVQLLCTRSKPRIHDRTTTACDVARSCGPNRFVHVVIRNDTSCLGRPSVKSNRFLSSNY